MPERALRERLLAAVEELLLERGPHEVSLREVARRADVSHAAPGHHFRNRRGMLTAYAAHGYLALVAAMVEEISRHPPANARDQLAAIGRSYVRFATERPGRFALMFQPEHLDRNDPALTAASDAAYGFLASTVARCIAEGEIPPERAPVAGIAAWSLTHGLATLWISGKIRERTQLADPGPMAAAVTAMFVEALFAPPRAR